MHQLTHNLPIQYDRIEKAFKAFYAYMRNSPHFNQFFESDEQIDRLIIKQARNFYNSFAMTEAEFIQNYERLGYMHAELGLPIEDMFAGLSMIRDHLLENTPADFHQKIYQLIEKMDKWLAKGYLSHQLKATQELITVSIKNIQKVTPEKHQHYVLRPINWLSRLLQSLQNPNFQPDSAEECPLTQIINQLDLEDEVRKQIHNAHQEQHTLGASFVFFYRDQNYTLVGFILSKLSAISLALSNQMSYVVSQNIIQKLQHDSLTGLLLRHSLIEQFELIRNLALGRKEGFGVLMMDIDHFKQINDTYGHQAGDEVLKTVGKLLKQHAREHDIAFRYGGEEFLIFVTHIDAQHLASVAERIRQAIENLTITWQEHLIPITLSIGCHWVKFNELDQPLEQILQQADQNLYHAKENGRNQVICTGIEH